MLDSVILVCAQYLIYVVIAAAAVCWLRLSRGNKLAYTQVGLLASAIGFLLVLVAAAIYYDPRPFTHPGITSLIPHAADNGFPSDHTVLAAVIAFTTLLYSRKIGRAMVVAMALIGIARIMAHVHSPIDIIGSIIIAMVAVAAANYAHMLWISRRGAGESGRKTEK